MEWSTYTKVKVHLTAVWRLCKEVNSEHWCYKINQTLDSCVMVSKCAVDTVFHLFFKAPRDTIIINIRDNQTFYISPYNNNNDVYKSMESKVILLICKDAILHVSLFYKCMLTFCGNYGVSPLRFFSK